MAWWCSVWFVDPTVGELNIVVALAQVARKVDLVYGGGSLGLMGEVSEAVHKGGGHVIGSVASLVRPFTASKFLSRSSS
jgi:predicted Rossmann-fold nucleotide-binding protein